MSGYSLTINSDHPHFASILSLLAGASMPAIAVNGATAASEDDESGDNANVVAGSLDANGLPWDERIHSTPAALTKKNVWRSKRNVSPALVTQVEAELRARATTPQQPPVQQFAPQPIMTPPANVPMPGQQFAQPAPQYQQPPMQPMQQFAPPPEQFTVPASITGNGEAVVLQAQPAPQYQQPPMQPMQPMQQFAPPAPQYQQPQEQPPVQYPVVDFNTFIQHIQLMLSGNRVDAGYLDSVAKRIGVNTIMDIAPDQDKINLAVKLMIDEQRWA